MSSGTATMRDARRWSVCTTGSRVQARGGGVDASIARPETLIRPASGSKWRAASINRNSAARSGNGGNAWGTSQPAIPWHSSADIAGSRASRSLQQAGRAGWRDSAARSAGSMRATEGGSLTPLERAHATRSTSGWQQQFVQQCSADAHPQAQPSHGNRSSAPRSVAIAASRATEIETRCVVASSAKMSADATRILALPRKQESMERRFESKADEHLYEIYFANRSNQRRIGRAMISTPQTHRTARLQSPARAARRTSLIIDARSGPTSSHLDATHRSKRQAARRVAPSRLLLKARSLQCTCLRIQSRTTATGPAGLSSGRTGRTIQPKVRTRRRHKSMERTGR